MTERLGALRASIAGRRLTGLLVTGLPGVSYLSGFAGSSGFMLIEPREATLFTDFRYETQATVEVGPGVSLHILSDGNWAALGERLADSPPGRRLGFEAGQLSILEHQRLCAACDSVIWEATDGLVEELRAVKGAEELEAIAAAVDLADAALEALLPEIRAGVTELELAARLEYGLRRAGSEPLPFSPIVAFGERSALPHAAPSERALASGDLVLLDFGARIDGYCSDMTRVFTLGRAATWQEEVHAAVLAACEAAMAALAPGVPCAAVDAAARDSLEATGLAERFGHSTGHGLGLEVHEAPRLHRKEQRVLRAGNVVTVEPGVYLPGRGGIRIEQAVVVESGGGRVMTGSSPDLIEL